MTTEILTLERRFGHSDHRRVAAKNPSSTRDRTLPSGKVAIGPAVQARANHGRWIADCPECAGAELVSFDNPVFFCCECRNAAAEHDLLPVLLPEPAKRREIEAALVARPIPAARTRQPGRAPAPAPPEKRQ